MQAPAVNAQQAGLVAASADMNAYAQACQFLLNPPAALAQASNSAGGANNSQAIGAGITSVFWNTPLLDRDMTWNVANPSRFTINTQGWYEFAAHVNFTAAAITAEGWLHLTTGPNNPLGSGISNNYWHGSMVNPPSNSASVSIAGIIPVLLYIGDFLMFQVQAAATCATASIGTGNTFGEWSHKLVSL